MQRTTAAESRLPQHFIRTHSLSPSLPLALTHDVPVNLIGGHLRIVRTCTPVELSLQQLFTKTHRHKHTHTHSLSLFRFLSIPLT